MSSTEYLESELIVLNSAFGILKNGSQKSNVLFNTKGLLRDDYNITRAEIVLCNVQIPASFQMINNNNNYLAYTTGPILTAVAKSITLTNGNYDGYGLLVEMINQFANNNDFFSISTSYTTANFVFTGDKLFSFNYTYSNCFYLLGLGNTTISSDNNYNLVAPFPFNLLSINSITIESSIISTTGYASCDNGYSSIIATITNSTLPYGIIVMENQAKIAVKIRNKQIDQIDILLYDQNNNLINFLNQDWSITLALNVYKLFVPIKPKTIYDAKHREITITPPEITGLSGNDPIDMELELLNS